MSKVCYTATKKIQYDIDNPLLNQWNGCTISGEISKEKDPIFMKTSTIEVINVEKKL